MAKKTSFEKVRDGLKRAASHAAGTAVLSTREVVLPEPPKQMTPREIAQLRQNKLHLSQAVFARYVNTATQTVQAWEQGRNPPSGCALRFLRLLDSKPEIVSEIMKPV